MYFHRLLCLYFYNTIIFCLIYKKRSNKRLKTTGNVHCARQTETGHSTCILGLTASTLEVALDKSVC